MRAKYMILDFINFAFLLALISFCIIFFISGNNFWTFWETIKAFSPIIFFSLLLFIKAKMNKAELKLRTKEDEMEIVLRLTFFDKILNDIILFLTPIIILLTPVLAGQPDLIDVFQVAVTFLIFYFWLRHLFNKNDK